jgi:hypothetical protein
MPKARPSRKARPKTGERRKTNQPLKIDKLPEEVRQSITYIRNHQFKTWDQIEEQSAKSYSKDWVKDGGGFIDWTKLDPEALDEFPGLKLPSSSLHRWYDLRVNQVQRQILAESEIARNFATKFSGAGIDDANEAVINAMRDEVFALAGKMDSGSRALYMDALGNLTLAMARIQRVDIQKRKVQADERKLALLEKDAELKRSKFQKEMDAAEKKITKGEPLTADDINQIRQRVFGIGPAPVAAG